MNFSIKQQSWADATTQPRQRKNVFRFEKIVDYCIIPTFVAAATSFRHQGLTFFGFSLVNEALHNYVVGKLTNCRVPSSEKNY